jgi:ABC-type protease/lipase transport system fused ATPase/permease subunit
MPFTTAMIVNAIWRHDSGSAYRRIRATLAKSPLPGRMHTDHPLRKPAASDSCCAPRVAGGTFAGMAAKVQEQNLAVFGDSGSGKTVLLSRLP